MILLRYFLISVLVCLLTVVTQVGGLVLLISLTTYRFIDRRWESMWKRMTAKSLCFAILYLVFVFIIVPLAAKPLGRVPLPIVEDRNLKPGNVWTCLLNRNYVRPQLRDITYKVAEDLKHKYPGATLSYLDANFPFIEKFPLFPHRSHNDGRKLDLSFQYNESGTGRITNDIPSPIGYGICEEPQRERRISRCIVPREVTGNTTFCETSCLNVANATSRLTATGRKL